MNPKRTIVTIILGMSMMIWLVCVIKSFFSNNTVLPTIAFLSLMVGMVIMGANTSDGPAEEKESWKEMWRKLSVREKGEYILVRIIMPFMLYALYTNYHMILINYFGQFNFQQALLYSFLLLNLNLLAPAYAGIGIRKWFPRIAEKLSYQ